MTKQYDLVVIGTGTAATTAAMRVRAAGWRVAVVDFRPFGGTCVLRGCDPKKMLMGVASAIDHVQRLRGKGIAGELHVEWPELLAFKRSFTDPVPEQRERRYNEKGIDTYHGHARFTGRSSLEVDGENLAARCVLIAAGAEPITLGIPGEEFFATSEDFLAMERLPRRILLVGGGYIASEFSHIAARSGAKVTVLQRGARMLEHFDPDLVGWLMDKFAEIGVDVHLGTTVEGIEKKDAGLIVRTTSEDGSATFEADCVIHAAGRAPDLDALDLEAGGIAAEQGRLELNEYLQSVSNPAVYAAGDAAQQGPPLTPVSGHDAGVAAANLLEGNRHRPDYRGVPSVAFTIPPIAAVGLSEEQARERELKFRTRSRKASGWFTARQNAEKTYGFKVLVEDDTGHIIGAHLVGPHADEVINVFALAIRHQLTADDLKTTMFAYPTAASDIGSML
jgi:glutathione reductase (NADPH)